MVCNKCLIQKYKFLLCYRDSKVLYKPDNALALVEYVDPVDDPEKNK